ncbi:hypothetical protein [Sphingopyxis sp. PET50]|uniref:hypothetical protein n=1 Tax=Sphingopyxis sp. PET50 TaxID=2976533 RepID=UPI0021AE7566|nr:hypothetical protein [Sphingopyxis sp. PET50]
MPHRKASLIALALLPFAAPASAQTINSAADIGANFTANYYAAAGYLVPDRTEQRKRVLARLEAVCASRLRADQRRCDRAWRIIADAHAELQARRAVEAGGADARP